MRAVRFLDWLAHFLYEPAALGRRCVAIPRWRERLHWVQLIPGSWLDRACAAYDRRLGLTEDEMRRAA